MLRYNLPLHLVSISAILIVMTRAMTSTMSPRLLRIFLSHFILFVFGSVCEIDEGHAAKKQSKEQATSENRVELSDIKSSLMMKSLAADLKRALCERGGYFPTCFVLDPQNCSELVGSTFSVCLKKENAVPAMLSRSKSVAIADRIGRCTGEELEKSLQPIRPPPQKCKEPRNWF